MSQVATVGEWNGGVVEYWSDERKAERGLSRQRGSATGATFDGDTLPGVFTRDTVTNADLPSAFCDLTRDICRDKA
jgi:hypothetical protein